MRFFLIITVAAYANNTMMTALAFLQRDVSSTKVTSRMRTKQPSDILEISGVPFLSLSSSSTPSLLYLSNKKTEPDLFEFFDPLLSPHAYPEGISPEKKPTSQSNDEIQQQQQEQRNQEVSKGDFGFKLRTDTASTSDQQKENIKLNQSPPSGKGNFGFNLPTESTTKRTSNEEKDDDEETKNLFDYFDPLMSPHSYPNGISPSTEPKEVPALEVVGNENYSSSINSEGNSNNRKKKKIGVLLMDHGSRKEASNARLQAMAKLYQLTLSNDDDDESDMANTAAPTIIVRAAHMEIATPSIHDGLKILKDEGVDEIICHPFFLSADGRHVKEDIPQIINEAVDDLWGGNTGATSIPIVTTEPVGSNTQLMLGAIHSLVRENSRYLKTTSGN